MMTLRHEALLDFASAWYGIASDRLVEFDDLLRRPLRSPEAVREATRAYLERRAAIDPDAADTAVAEAFRALLADLEAAGEDVDRVHAWALCLTPHMQPWAARRALTLLKEPFDRFARGRREQARHLEEDLLERLSLSYAAEVVEPHLAFVRRIMASSGDWLERPGRRSPWDEVLWRFFAEIHVDPALAASGGYGEMLAREWWRRTRGTLTDAERAGLWAEQIDNLRAYSRREVPSWKTDGSVAEPTILAGFPEFEEEAFPRT